MRMGYSLVFACTAVFGLSAAASAQDLAAARARADLAKMVQTCAACHGPNGRSVSPTFPNLAGQSADYIKAQLKAFKDETRSDPDAQAYMWGMALQLNDTMIGELADYFSKQAPAPGQQSDPDLIAKGKVIFETGVPASQIPPCATCHGAQAQGFASFPAQPASMPRTC